MKQISVCLAALMLGTVSAQADVHVSNIFSDNMVLQRDIAAPVWGTADPGEAVTVTIGDSQASSQADAQGKWMVKLPAMKANPAPRELVITGKNTLTIKNVLVGDVWVCSGQSNMEMSLGGCNAPQDIASANFPTLRRIKLDHRAMGTASTDVPGRWEVCDPGRAPGFTAVGFYFARRIQKETGLPIGLIDDNWGGTRIEPWIPASAFQIEPPLANTLSDLDRREKDYRNQLGARIPSLEQWIADTRKALAAPDAMILPLPALPNDPLTDAGSPTTLYNGMIAPIVPYAIKGALWYQGESNGGEEDSYFQKMHALIAGWREVWKEGEFPFYWVQLANFTQPNTDPGGSGDWGKTRMAQLKALQIPHTGMAVIIDIGETEDIHPKDKFDVGERLSLWALHNDYGQKDLVFSGPLFKSMKIEDNKARISFDYVGSGLMVGKKQGRTPTVEDKDGKLTRFAIAGEDRKWYWADAVIDGDTVVVSSPDVLKPVAVRYAFSMNPTGCNLYNKEGLPASPFHTETW